MRSKILVLSPMVPQSLDDQVPWHFFQELQAIVDQGVRLWVASPVQPTYSLPGISFHRLKRASLKRNPGGLPAVLRLLLRHRAALGWTTDGDIRKWLRAGQMNLSLLRLAREVRPDVIHSHWAFPNGSAGIMAARQLGIPLVMTLRGFDHLVHRESGYGESLDPFYERLLRAAVRSADRITVCCSDSVRRLEELGLGDLTKVDFVYHSVGDDRFSGSSAEAQRLKRELGLERRDVVACVAGMDYHRKGHTVLFDAFSRLHAEFSKTVLLLIGDGPLSAELGERAAKLGIAEHVRFLGRVHPMEVQHYLRMSTFTVLPTLTEVFGNVVFESLYVGTPVVASAVGTPGDVLPRGPYGYTFPPGDVEGLLNCMRRVLRDQPVARQMAEEGSRFVRTNMTLASRASSFVRLYQELSASRTAVGPVATN